jgi:hypothetical protein
LARNIRQICRVVLQFRAMLRWRSAERLKPWIELATVSGFPAHGTVFENAAPRFGSSEAINDNAMEQWPYVRVLPLFRCSFKQKAPN